MKTTVTKKKRWLIILCLIGAMSLFVRLLIKFHFDDSALLYVGVPFLISILLTFAYPESENTNWKMRYLKISMASLIVFLGSSVVLFEGFICVVMFMPIYFAVLLVMFLAKAISVALNKKNNNSRLLSSILPLLLLLSSFEGTHQSLSFERQNSVTVSKVIDGNVISIKNKLIQPMDLDKERNALLSLFPMPYKIEAGSLNEGDLHHIYLRYHRWFFTNTHEGSMVLKIAKVGDDYVETEFVQDTSYFSNYLNLQGTRIDIEEMDNNKTKVSLTINYERSLDPAWYFDPLQKKAIQQAAELLIKEVITPD